MVDLMTLDLTWLDRGKLTWVDLRTTSSSKKCDRLELLLRSCLELTVYQTKKTQVDLLDPIVTSSVCLQLTETNEVLQTEVTNLQQLLTDAKQHRDTDIRVSCRQHCSTVSYLVYQTTQLVLFYFHFFLCSVVCLHLHWQMWTLRDEISLVIQLHSYSVIINLFLDMAFCCTRQLLWIWINSMWWQSNIFCIKLLMIHIFSIFLYQRANAIAESAKLWWFATGINNWLWESEETDWASQPPKG